ncbi:MAG: sulfotransferase [Magnetococcales bacterium]|nr:sulfotransferase [Magnetococcales bacterium]
MDMKPLFIIGIPRSGTTLLERILSAHPEIHGGPEPHIITPLAHLGVWANVDKAPYDNIVAGIGQRAFVASLPRKEQDYWDACRAYCDHLYSQHLYNTGCSICLDKTPEYAVVLPFLRKVYPNAHYVVITRHPVAIFSSFSKSFFENDYELTHRHDPLLERYIPVIADFLRNKETPFLHVSYEEFVVAPELWTEKICQHIGIPFYPEMVNYGEVSNKVIPKGLGDPVNVDKNKRPSTRSLTKWAEELATSPEKLSFMQQMINSLDPLDLEKFGYPLHNLWSSLESITGNNVKPAKKWSMTSYALQRKIIVRVREMVRKNNSLKSFLQTCKVICEVLLRDT